MSGKEMSDDTLYEELRAVENGEIIPVYDIEAKRREQLLKQVGDRRLRQMMYHTVARQPFVERMREDSIVDALHDLSLRSRYSVTVQRLCEDLERHLEEGPFSEARQFVHEHAFTLIDAGFPGENLSILGDGVQLDIQDATARNRLLRELEFYGKIEGYIELIDTCLHEGHSAEVVLRLQTILEYVKVVRQCTLDILALLVQHIAVTPELIEKLRDQGLSYDD